MILSDHEYGSMANKVLPEYPVTVGVVGALLMGPDGGFITGSDFLMDVGATAAFWYADVAEVRS